MGTKLSLDGIKTTLIKGEEAAHHRAVVADYMKNRSILDDFSTVIKTAKLLPKIILTVAALGVAVGFAVKFYGVAL